MPERTYGTERYSAGQWEDRNRRVEVSGSAPQIPSGPALGTLILQRLHSTQACREKTRRLLHNVYKHLAIWAAPEVR
jgi:hypothetical protein